MAMMTAPMRKAMTVPTVEAAAVHDGDVEDQHELHERQHAQGFPAARIDNGRPGHGGGGGNGHAVDGTGHPGQDLS
jgi:hypothetical protein